MTTSHQIKRVQQAICCPDGCESPDECIHLSYRDEARAVLEVTESIAYNIEMNTKRRHACGIYTAEEVAAAVREQDDVLGAPV